MNILERTIQYLSCLFLFLLPWQTILIFQERFVNGAKWEYGTIGLYATEILGWILVLLFMWWYIVKIKNSSPFGYKFSLKLRMQNFSWSRDRIFVLSILLFTLYSLLFTPFANEQFLAFQHAQRILLGSLLFLLFYIGPVNPRHALWAFVLGSIPVSLLGIWQFLAQATFASTLLGLSAYVIHEPGTSIIASESIGRWLRAYGSFSHPNVFGGYLVFVILSALMLYRSSVRGGRVVLNLVLVLQSAALFFTFSRSAWISVAMVTLLYCCIVVRDSSQPHPNPALRKGRGLTAMLPVCSIMLSFFVLTAIYFPLVSTRLSATSVNEVASITERTDGYDQARQLFKDNVLFGVGGGNYTHALMTLYPDMPGWWYQPVHMVPLLVAVEVGVIGVALLLFVMGSFLRVQKIPFGTMCALFLVLSPLILLDHYVWSSFVGLAMGALYLSIGSSKIKKLP